MLCVRALRLTVLKVSQHARLAGSSGCLPSKSLAGLYYLQIVEAAQVQTQLRETSEPQFQVGVTHKSHQACHPSSYNGNFCPLNQYYAHMLLILPIELTLRLRLCDTDGSDLVLL